MLKDIVSTSFFLCESALLEPDQTLSAIRIVDLLFVSVPPNAPKDAVPLTSFNCILILKTTSRDTSKHVLELKLQRSTGEIGPVGESHDVYFSGKDERAPMALSARIQVTLGIKNYGTAYLIAFIDGGEVARTPITFVKVEPTATQS